MFDDPAVIEREIAVFTDELICEAKKGRLHSCPFEGWSLPHRQNTTRRGRNLTARIKDLMRFVG